MYGLGILRGLGVTLKHFVDTYVDDLKYLGSKYIAPEKLKVRQSPDGIGLFTVQYPEEKLDVPERFRYIPFLIYETQEDGTQVDRCTSCGICAKVCPPQCIWIERVNDPATGRPIPAPKDFFIDVDICMNCGYCAEFCPFDAIKMDHDYELASYDRSVDHIFDKARLDKPLEYYAQIRPTFYAEEEAVRAEEERKKAEKAAAAAAKKAAQAAAASLELNPNLDPKDLRQIPDIKGRIPVLLKKAGITDLDDMAKADVATLNGILEEATLKTPVDPSDWPAQAKTLLGGGSAGPALELNPKLDPKDLRQITEIKGRIPLLLKKAGIPTLDELAATPADKVQAVVDEANLKEPVDASDWPAQAKALLKLSPAAAAPAVQPAPAAQAAPAVQPAPAPAQPDDLKKIEGIGPKSERVLNEAGITTFAQLAATPIDELTRIKEAGGLPTVVDPASWAAQAKLAAEGKWDELQAMQDNLKGGRDVD